MCSGAMTDYVELHCHSNFSLLDGASHPEDLVRRASELGMKALALTDHDAVYGAPRFAHSAQAHGIRPLFGAELTFAGGFHLALLVKDVAGWRNLCALISRGRAKAPKGQAELPVNALEGHTAGLIALSGCRRGEVASALLRHDRPSALSAAGHLQALFERENFWIELQNHLLPDDEMLIGELAGLAEKIGAGIVATNNVHYAGRDGHRLQDVLVCIKHLTTLEASQHLRRPNSEYYLKSAQQMAPLFTTYPQALANTACIAEQCDFALEYGLQDLPEFPRPEDQSVAEYLRELCEAALPKRYGDAPSTVIARLDYELEVIKRSGLANYFLIMWNKPGSQVPRDDHPSSSGWQYMEVFTVGWTDKEKITRIDSPYTADVKPFSNGNDTDINKVQLGVCVGGNQLARTANILKCKRLNLKA